VQESDHQGRKPKLPGTTPSHIGGTKEKVRTSIYKKHEIPAKLGVYDASTLINLALEFAKISQYL
jgi:hypothetical protein